MTVGRAGISRGHWFAAVVMAAAFVLFQATTLDYGTTTNDLPHIKNHAVADGDVVDGSGLDRPTVVGRADDAGHESYERWIARYKLYSIVSDEMVNIMALARIKPRQGRFDPGFYQYGGAWLYPLGAWYAALAATGVLPLAGLDTMLAEPDRMDAVYIWGRAFVVLAVAASALFLFAALGHVTSPMVALLGTAVFLLSPATVMYSQILKPHWYALLWVNGALFLTVSAWIDGHLSCRAMLGLGGCLGLAVGASIPNGLFAVLVWFALVAGMRAGWVPVLALVIVPLAAVVVWIVTNPFLFINWSAVALEGSAAAAWFRFDMGPAILWNFVHNSLAVGFGVALTAAVLAAIPLTARRSLAARMIAVGISAAICLVAGITAMQADWNSNFRYAAWLLPVGILLVLASRPSRPMALLIVLVTLTGLQSAPLKLAFFDENDPRYSTRLAAAAWIGDTVPAGRGLCVGTTTPAPYDVPPIRFADYRINTHDCEWLVQVERERRDRAPAPGWDLVRRFAPRYSPTTFPTVFEHINPQISVYRRHGG